MLRIFTVNDVEIFFTYIKIKTNICADQGLVRIKTPTLRKKLDSDPPLKGRVYFLFYIFKKKINFHIYIFLYNHIYTFLCNCVSLCNPI